MHKKDLTGAKYFRHSNRSRQRTDSPSAFIYMLVNAKTTISPPPEPIIWCYGQWQPML